MSFRGALPDTQQYRILKYGDLRAISVPRKTIRNLTLLDGKYEWNIMQEYAVRIQNQIMTARTYRGKSSFQVSTIARLMLQ